MPEMTTSVRWTMEETRRTILLVFSGLTVLNVVRRLIKDRRIGVGEALAGIAAVALLLKEFGRRPAPSVAVAPEESQESEPTAA